MVFTTAERRCCTCQALLYEVRGVTVIKAIKGFRMEVQPVGIVETTCKCGTVDIFTPTVKQQRQRIPVAASY